MKAVLIFLYPKSWRQKYGDEYKLLLEDTGISFGVICNSVCGAAVARWRIGRFAVAVSGALLFCIGSSLVCRRLGLTANIAWVPSTPSRAVGLLITYTPLLYLLYAHMARVFYKRRQI